MKFSNADKLRELVTEVGYRRHVYPRLVREKRMSAALAKRRTEIMEEILEEFSARAYEDAKPHLLKLMQESERQ